MSCQFRPLHSSTGSVWTETRIMEVANFCSITWQWSVLFLIWHCSTNAVGGTAVDIGAEPMVTVGLDYVAAPDFTYNSSSANDPPFWHEQYPDCEGYHQSPIDIRLDECNKSAKKRPIIVRNTHIRPEEVTLLNDRYTVKYLLTWGHKYPYVTGGELGKKKYIPRDIHFHWGDADDRGSEHAINGQKFSFEMHIVCFNEKYGNVADASNFLDGITVISQIFDVRKQAKRYYFMDLVDQVKKKGTKTVFKNALCRFAFDEFLFAMPEEWDYVVYEGSFTTPPCYESVTWILFLKVNSVLNWQLSRFRQIEGLEGHIADNFRPTQDMNDRTCEINN